MKIHVAHLDPHNGDQSMIHDMSRASLLQKITAWARENHPDKNLAADDDVIDFLNNETEDYVFIDTIDIHDAYTAAETHAAQIVWEAILDCYDLPLKENDWIKWDGGSIPVPDDALVEVRFRLGTTETRPRADAWNWGRGPDIGVYEIVSYRMIEAWPNNLFSLRDNIGAYELRDLATRIAVEIERQWIGLEEIHWDSGLAFDWEVVPALLSEIDWLSADPAAIPDGKVREVVEREIAALDKRMEEQRQRSTAQAAYTQRCRNAAGRLWGYEDLVNDAGAEVLNGFQQGTDPLELMQAIGEELDLSTPDPMTAESLKAQYPII